MSLQWNNAGQYQTVEYFHRCVILLQSLTTPFLLSKNRVTIIPLIEGKERLILPMMFGHWEYYLWRSLLGLGWIECSRKRA